METDTARRWHVYGHMEESMGAVALITVTVPNTEPVDQAIEFVGVGGDPVTSKLLATFDHKPTEAETDPLYLLVDPDFEADDGDDDGEGW